MATERRPISAKTALLLLAYVLRMGHIQNRSLWYDEAFAVLYASLRPEQIIHGTVTPVAGAGAADVHPLLYYFLLHGWMKIAGRSPLAVRYLSVLLGLTTVALLARMAAHYFGRRVGLLTGLLAAASPFHVAYSQETRMYALLALAAILTTCAFLRAVTDGGRRRWTLYAIAAALTLYAHNLGAVFLLSLHLMLILRRDRWRHLPALLLADGTALLLFGPWLINVLPGQLGFVGRGYWLTAPGAKEAVRVTMLPLLTVYETPPARLLPLALTGSLLLLLLLLRQTIRTRSLVRDFLLLTWTPPALLFLASYRWHPVYLERALLPTALLYLIPIAWLLTGRRLPRPVRLSLLMLLLTTMAGSLGHHYTYSGFPRPPFPAAANYLKDHLGPTEAIVHTTKLTYFPLHYYAPDLPARFLADPPGSPQDTLAEPTQEALGLFASPTITEAVGEAARIHLVYFSREIEEFKAMDAEPPALAWLERHGTLEETAQFADLIIARYRLTRRNISPETGPKTRSEPLPRR